MFVMTFTTSDNNAIELGNAFSNVLNRPNGTSKEEWVKQCMIKYAKSIVFEYRRRIEETSTEQVPIDFMT